MKQCIIKHNIVWLFKTQVIQIQVLYVSSVCRFQDKSLWPIFALAQAKTSMAILVHSGQQWWEETWPRVVWLTWNISWPVLSIINLTKLCVGFAESTADEWLLGWGSFLCFIYNLLLSGKTNIFYLPNLRKQLLGELKLWHQRIIDSVSASRISI